MPEDALKHLDVRDGYTLSISADSTGCLLTRVDQEDLDELNFGRRVMQQHRDVLKMLADS